MSALKKRAANVSENLVQRQDCPSVQAVYNHVQARQSVTVTGHLHTSVALPQRTALPVPTGWGPQPPEHVRKQLNICP